VDDYHTASYRLTVVPERPAVMVGEPISWQVQATYFDGTAAAGIALAQKSGEGQTQPFTTDQNGAAVMETVADNFYQESGYILTSANGDVIADLPEGGQVEASAYCDVFLNDQDISGDFTRAQKQYQLKLNAHDIVLDDLQDYEDREQLLDQAYRDITTPVTLNASLIHIGYQPQMRSYFDEYTQQTVEYTDYESFEELESSFTVTLADSAEHLFDGVLATGDSYRMELRGLDKAGRAVERNFYLWSAEDVGSSLWLQTYREQEDGLYQIGENISLAVQSGADNAPLTMAERSKMLFFCSKNEIVDYEISGDNHFERIFTGTDSPNLNISAVYFADGVYHSTYCYRAALDPAAYTGTVSITADQRSYAPGEAVHLDISCTDPQGKPFAGWVNVCVVDEKLLQIKENYANITTQLFDDLIPYGYTDFSLNANTEKDAQVLNAGGKGDGSGGLGGTRDDFRDMAVCATLKTDVNGEAKLEFTLPDDITGWRVTAQAYGTGPVVAYRQVGLSATLPFFGELRLGDVFRVGDSPHIGLRAAGSDVQATAPVTYSISIPELNFSAKADGRAADWTEIALPILTAGEYTVAMTAASGLHTDRQTRHFTVTDTLATHVVHDCYGVEPGLTIAKTGAEITTLVFTDSQNAQNIASLLDLAGQDSVRLEQCLAALYARQALTELWGENGHGITQLQINEAQLNRLADYQQQDGGLSSFPYGDSDIFTSALAAVLGAQYFDQRALTLYFEHYLSEGCGRQEQAMAYWGLAALRQPVLQDITALLKQDNDAISQ
ncbi:MAG: alpha-2-macroglobulin family protein, partial [Clostridiales bacterium]